MVKTILFGAILFIGLAIYPASETWAQSQKDAVCGGGCGGGCGPCGGTSGGNLSNRSYNRPNAAEIAAKKATALNNQGIAAYDKKDWATAEADFKEALELNPNNQVIRENLAKAQAQVDEVQRQQEQRQKDKVTTNNMQQAIQNFAQTSLSAAPSPGGLDFNDGNAKIPATAGNVGNNSELDFMTGPTPSQIVPSSVPSLKHAVGDAPSDRKVAPGLLGHNVAKPNLTAVSVPVPGSNTKAGDQLLGATATAAAKGDLTANYDIGGAKSAGSLKIPTNPSINPATFPAKVKNDPRMIDALNQLGVLQAKRSQLNTELQKLTTERNVEKDPQKTAELTKQVGQKNNDYQANLLAITKGEQTVKKTKRIIETEEGKAPNLSAPNAAPANQ